MMKYAVIDMQSGKVVVSLYEIRAKALELKKQMEVKDLVELKGFKDVNRWLVSLPLADLGFRILKFPFGDKVKIRRVLPLELENILLLKPEEIVHDFRVRKTEMNAFEIELIFIEKTRLDKTLQALKDSGIIVSAATSLDFMIGHYSGDDGPSSEERLEAARKTYTEPVINLMSRDFLRANVKPEVKQKILLGYWLAVVFLALMCAASAFELRSLKIKNSTYEALSAGVYTALFPGAKTVSGYYQLQAKLKEVNSKNDFMPHAEGLEFLRFVSSSDLGTLRVESFKLDEKSLQIKGNCRALSDAEGLKNKIDGYFERSSALESRRSPDGQFLFTIRTEYKR